MTYYKMSYLTGFIDDSEDLSNKLIAIKGINEFGEESYVMMNDGRAFQVNETPFDIIFKHEGDSITRGYSIAESRRVMINEVHSVPYLHLLSKTGTAYRAEYLSGQDYCARLVDGDVLLNVGAWNLRNGSRDLLEKEWAKIQRSGGAVEVLKIIDGKYVPLCFKIKKGDIGAEYHFMSLMESEIKHFKDYIL